jgi:class 3 adenylate cyclase
MINRFVTCDPIIYSIGACLIFVFTSVVFIIYDSKVERRQKVVLGSAERTNAVVSSLFPSQVRDQILNDANKSKVVAEDEHKHFFRRKDTWDHQKDTTSDTNNTDTTVSQPIADLYPETTVLFADIKGFTFWSASHTPIEVFTLLETLYNEFDKCARSHRVFKVETIGDCYVAVVGLPEPRKNHAVVMVRFAEDMLDKIKLVLPDLATTLGDKTLDLALRIGLNSGPTTAGVLRGEKSRFQLFGDTVNTAARMESNGMANRIHCSQSTADQLTVAGKDQWLVKREDLVEAKGKGAMQTYWVKPHGYVSSGSALSTKQEDKVSSDGKAYVGMIFDAIDELPVGSIHGSNNSF